MKKRLFWFVGAVAASAALLGAERAAATAETFPWVDLSGDKTKDVIVAEGRPDLYQGHPTTALLPDGTVVATTYIKYWNDARKQSVVCTRFRVDETDRRIGLDGKSVRVRPEASGRDLLSGAAVPLRHGGGFGKLAPCVGIPVVEPAA